MTRIVIISALCFGFALSGCNNQKDQAQLQMEVDSLNAALKNNENIAATLSQVGSLIDSIDAHRQVLNTHMIEGTTYEDYAARLESISSYVRDTRNKLEQLSIALNKSHDANSWYAVQLKKLKGELESRDQQIAVLTKEVTETRAQNETLSAHVAQQREQLAQRLDSLKMDQANILSMEKRLDEMQISSKATKADLYFQYARAMETAASRTHFAPRKKKASQRQALELYQMAYTLGKIEAQDRIRELKKEVG
jgi:chromosome segregation ATPase